MLWEVSRKRSKNPVLCESSELLGIQRFRKSRAVSLERSVREPLKFGGVGKKHIPALLVRFNRAQQPARKLVLLVLRQRSRRLLEGLFEKLRHGPILARVQFFDTLAVSSGARLVSDVRRGHHRCARDGAGTGRRCNCAS